MYAFFKKYIIMSRSAITLPFCKTVLLGCIPVAIKSGIVTLENMYQLW